MRAVLDTNVVVSALIWGGPPFALVQAATSGSLLLFTSPFLLAELSDVLERPHMARQLERLRGPLTEALALYAALTATVVPAATRRIVADDPDDDHVIAAAVAAQADLVITGDQHLLSLGTIEGIRIVTPRQALRILAP